MNENHKMSENLITKAAQLASHEVTESDLKAINNYTMTPLGADDVFVFKAVLCDNELDRDFEQFTQKALEDMRKLFKGRTVIKNHCWSADDQVARIYATELVQTEKTLKNGEAYTQLVAHCYMVKTASNADLIAEIKGGIKKEGSIGFRAAKAICSICGTDNTKSYCPHFGGRSYTKENAKVLCTFALDGVTDAYEFSLVAVPAQKAAGVTKSYTGKTCEAPEEVETTETEVETKQVETANKEAEAMLRARIIAAKAKSNKSYKED